jgi:Putative adhesin
MNSAIRGAGLVAVAAAAVLLSGCSTGSSQAVRPASDSAAAPTTAASTAAPTTVTATAVAAAAVVDTDADKADSTGSPQAAAAGPAPRVVGEPPPTSVTTETVAGPVTSFVLSSDSGRITVTGTDAKQVVITRRTFATPARPAEQVTHTGGDLKIVSPHCAADNWPAAPCRIDYEVKVPRGLPVRISGASGDLTTVGLSAAQGATSASGNVTITNAGGTVDAVSDSGDVAVTAVAVLPALTATSTSGSVTAAVPGGAYRVQATTGSGDSSITVPNTPTAAALIHLATVSGDVELDGR